MASTTATWTPGSLQLRWACAGGHRRKNPAVFLRTRVKRFDCGIGVRVVCRNSEASWVASSGSADGLSGWSSESDNVEENLESQRKKNKWIGGIVGAGVAGVVIVAGLTLATLALSKRSARGSTQQMEPLTAQQEVLLASDEQNDRTEKSKVNEVDRTCEKERDLGKHSFSVLEPSGAIAQSNPNDADNETLLVHNNDGISNSIENYASTEEDMKLDSAFDENSVVRVTGGHELSSEASKNLASVDSSTSTISSDMASNPNTDHGEGVPDKESTNVHLDSPADSAFPSDSVVLNTSGDSQRDAVSESESMPARNIETVVSSSSNENQELSKTLNGSIRFPVEVNDVEDGSSISFSVLESAYPIEDEVATGVRNEMDKGNPFSVSPKLDSFSSAGIPAPSRVSTAHQVNPGKVLVPAEVDQVQGQALAALQAMKVIEADVQPTDICTRREYARWLVSASSTLSRNTVSKVYPAMYIENVTELAFDDITPDDPDFVSIQGLAEAGLISSKLSRRDLLNGDDTDDSPFNFSPASPVSRQDLVSWKMALEKKRLPEADRKMLYQVSGFIDIERIDPDACPALVADLSAGDQGIIAHAFGYTKLFQPDKPVTKAQAAIALATGEASDSVSEELARIEAESMAEKAVAAHNALVAEVEKDINASFEKELSMEREKIDAVQRMAEEARRELERLRAEREEENLALVKERASIESEMEILSKLRREVEEQLQNFMSNKAEIAYEKERINKLRSDSEIENQEIERLQYELEVERKALSMARAWAEDEARRATEQAKALEEARDRWERHGIKVVVDSSLHEETVAGATWLNVGKQFSVKETVNRGERLVGKLKAMAADARGKSKVLIDKIIQKILFLLSELKHQASKAGQKAEELRDAAVSRASKLGEEFQQRSSEFGLNLKEGAKRVAGDCRVGVEKLTQKFKT